MPPRANLLLVLHLMRPGEETSLQHFLVDPICFCPRLRNGLASPLIWPSSLCFQSTNRPSFPLVGRLLLIPAERRRLAGWSCPRFLCGSGRMKLNHSEAKRERSQETKATMSSCTTSAASSTPPPDSTSMISRGLSPVRRWKHRRLKSNSFSERRDDSRKESSPMAQTAKEPKQTLTYAAVAAAASASKSRRRQAERELERHITVERDVINDELRSPRFEPWSCYVDNMDRHPLAASSSSSCVAKPKSHELRQAFSTSPAAWNCRVGVAGCGICFSLFDLGMEWSSYASAQPKKHRQHLLYGFGAASAQRHLSALSSPSRSVSFTCV